ncbi:hypothetical protein GCM10027404_12610 [Arthrobacter tumbae]|uniref:hypothetical protein n=1 Tax=Arthrobacter tumbae TaxID=163874 RepID=UPI00195D9955|nr:hypothetical protein [Arthrobacter tumbae]MBM7782547.1 hypothetical protein [Arthrobacter tumbae]
MNTAGPSADQVPAFRRILNLDPPGGLIDQYLETFQQKHLQINLDSAHEKGPSERLRTLHELVEGKAAHGPILIFATKPEGAVELEELASAMPPQAVLYVFAREHRKSGNPRVRVQGVPAKSSDEEFARKVGGHIFRILGQQPQGSPINPGSAPFPSEHYESEEVPTNLLAPYRGTVRTVRDGVPFDYFCDFKPEAHHLVVFGQSTVQRPSVTLPAFHRWEWSGDVNASVMVVNDPTLYLGESLEAGWWIGTPERDYAREMAEIVSALAKRLGFSAENVIFYGDSVGGYSSLHMAACLPGSKAVVDSPQIDLRQCQQHRSADAATMIALHSSSVAETPTSLVHRVDVIERFRHEERVPDFLYLQNLRDVFHVEKHYTDFKSRTLMLAEQHEWARSNAEYFEYSAWSVISGSRFFMSRHDTVQHINRIIRSSDYSSPEARHLKPTNKPTFQLKRRPGATSGYGTPLPSEGAQRNASYRKKRAIALALVIAALVTIPALILTLVLLG